MPYLKPIKGHTSVKGVKRYLERDGRALARDFINITDDWEGRDWADQMDWSRRVWDNDKQHGGKPARTYNHYVLSPDPKDGIQLEEFREFMMEFLHGAFEDRFDIAVIYHDDNENGILHAHFIVNNTDIETGKRLAPWLTNKKVKEIRSLCERMAKERGWSNFLESDDLDSSQVERDMAGKLALEQSGPSFDGITEGNKKTPKKPFVTDRESYYTKTEREILEAGGWSWKEDIRARVRIARELSTTEEGFLRALNILDVDVSTTDRGDYRYAHPENPAKWQINGYRLGQGFSRNGVRSLLADEDMRKIVKPATMERAMIMEAFDAWRIEGIRTVGTIHPAMGITLNDVADAMEVMNEKGIRSLAGFDRAFEKAASEPEALRISFAKGCVEQLTRDAKAAKPHAGRKAIRPEIAIERMDGAEARAAIEKARKERMKDAPAKPKRTEDRRGRQSADSSKRSETGNQRMDKSQAKKRGRGI